MGGIALLDELEEDLVLELLRGRLAKSDHVLNQPKNIVQLDFLSDSDDNLKHLERLVLINLTHKGNALIQRPILCNQNIFVILCNPDEICPLPKYSLEELLNVEVDDLIQEISWSLLDLKITVLTIGREELFLISSYLELILL